MSTHTLSGIRVQRGGHLDGGIEESRPLLRVALCGVEPGYLLLGELDTCDRGVFFHMSHY